MKHLLPIAFSSLLLAACVDTTGLSADLSSGPHPRSNQNGAVIVTEFADLQCPACKAAHTLVVEPLLEQYGTQIRYEYHHFPLQSIHRFALPAAEAAECAADQGKFWEFIDMNYAQQDKLSKNIFADWAEELQLDMDLFDRCTASHIKRDAIQAEYKAGQSEGVTGTPTFFVNGQRVESNIESIGAAIRAAIEKQGQML